MSSAETATISREELRRILARGGLLLLDAQAPGWYEREHLPGALEMPESEVASRIEAIGPNRDQEIVVYCWSEACGSSVTVALELRRLGYRNVRRFAGGKKEWLEAGLPIVTSREGSS